ncbi:MAG: hypothetical protein AB8G95_09800 [Anaerolineae bacterium]
MLLSKIETIYKRRLTSKRVLAIIFVALFFVLFRPVVSLIDPVGYYAWPRSVLIDGDLDVSNEFDHYGMDEGLPDTATGYQHNQWSAGSGIFWLPAMGVAHGIALAGERIGLSIAADGYSWPYALAASLTSAVTAFGAVLLIFNISRRYFSDFAALISTLAVWLATPLVFYQYHQPLMSHAHDIFLNALFVWLWLDARKNRHRPLTMLLLGLVIGAAMWVRIQNGVLLVVLALEISYDFLNQIRQSEKRFDLRPIINRTGSLAVGFALAFVPQVLFWRRVFGSWVLNSYENSGGGEFEWFAHMLEVLISSNRGLFVWAPVTFVCLLGLRQLFKADQRLTLVLGGVTFLQWVVIGSWSAWSGGDAFGPRFWIALFPFFGLSLAALLNRFDTASDRSRFVVASILIVFVGWNFLLMFQYSLGLVAPAGPVDLGEMVWNQFTLIPNLVGQIWGG